MALPPQVRILKKLTSTALLVTLLMSAMLPLVSNAAGKFTCNEIFGDLNGRKAGDEAKQSESLPEMLKHGSPVGREERMKVEAKLSEIQTQLKKDFVGWDNVVEQLMNASRLLIFYGDDIVQKPVVVPILGFPGYGKTTLIQRWQKLMGFEDIHIQENIEKNQAYIPYERIIGLGRPAREAPEVSKQRPLVDFVVTIDEIQNLLDAKQVDELIKATNEETVGDDRTGDKMRAVTEQRAKVEKILMSRQFFWEMLGNGTYPVKSADPAAALTTVQQYMPYYQQGLAADAKFATRLRKLEDADRAPDASAEDNQAEIDNIKTQMANQATQSNSYKTEIVRALKKLKTENGESLGDLATMSPIELLQLVKIGPDEFKQQIEENYSKAKSSTVLNRFNRGIIIITGKPNTIISDLVKKSTASNGHIDPETLRRNTLQVSDPEIMSFFTGKLGPEAGWQSRLNAANWKILAPFGEKQWRDLIRRSLVRFKDLTTQDGKLYTEKEIQIEFDETLVEHLYKSAVDPLGGPRNYFDALNQSLTTLPTQVPLMLRQYMEKHGAWQNAKEIKLKVSFSAETHELVVQEVGGENGGFVAKIRLALSEKANVAHGNGMNFPAIQKAQMAVYQAARIVVGSAMFRSLPKTGIEAVPSSEETIDSLWSHPDVNYFSHLKAKLMVSMAGYVAEKMVMDKSGVDLSVHAKIDMEYIVSMIGQLKAELEKRRELDQYKSGPDDPASIRELFGHSMSQDKVVAAIFKNDDKAVFKYLDHEVRKIMESQKDLVSALASNLLEKSRLEPEEIRQGFATYAKQPGVVDRAKQGLKRFFGGADVAPVPHLDVAHIVKNGAGTIQNPVPQLNQAYPLDHRHFSTTPLGRIYERLEINMQNKLE